MFLMMSRVFDELGYRRYEWKCDGLNGGSRRAAERLGFGFEGVFRQATIYKGRNRDTAWYAITDQDWPAIKAASRFLRNGDIHLFRSTIASRRDAPCGRILGDLGYSDRAWGGKS
jgi:hypothetical protein